MRLNRFIGNFNIKKGSLKLEDKELFNQFRNVLKLKIGERVILCDGQMNEGVAEIKGYGKYTVDVEILEISKNQNEPVKYVILYCAVLKKENFEIVVQKATEVGIKEITPIITERTVKLSIRQDRLEKIIKEAAEQSGRGIVPVLREPVSFSKAIEMAKNSDLNIIFDLSGENVRHPMFNIADESFKDLERLDNKGRVGVWIGSEGGWTGKELESVRRLNFKIINLGKLTLRAETAAIVATYLVVHNLACR